MVFVGTAALIIAKPSSATKRDAILAAVLNQNELREPICFSLFW